MREIFIRRPQCGHCAQRARELAVPKKRRRSFLKDYKKDTGFGDPDPVRCRVRSSIQ
jgi:hypothetical protein